MNKYFYSQIADIVEIENEIDILDLADGEKKELKDLAMLNLHHAIVEAVLGELSEKDKKQFLINLARGNDAVIFSHLGKNIKSIDEVIKKTAKQLKEELKADVVEVMTKK